MILSFSALQMLNAWERAHHLACRAEHGASHADGASAAPSPGIAETAAELRASADLLFRRVLDARGFGDLRPMPRLPGNPK